MSKLHIKKNDTVVVLAGEDKGKTGKVLKVLVEKNRALRGLFQNIRCSISPIKNRSAYHRCSKRL